MRQQELISWAVRGIDAGIDRVGKYVNKGVQYLLQFEQDKAPNIPKSEHEVKEIIRKKRTEIETLAKMKFDLKWHLSELEENEQ